MRASEPNLPPCQVYAYEFMSIGDTEFWILMWPNKEKFLKNFPHPFHSLNMIFENNAKNRKTHFFKRNISKGKKQSCNSNVSIHFHP